MTLRPMDTPGRLPDGTMVDWVDAEETVAVKPFTAFVFVSLNDQTGVLFSKPAPAQVPLKLRRCMEQSLVAGRRTSSVVGTSLWRSSGDGSSRRSEGWGASVKAGPQTM